MTSRERSKDKTPVGLKTDSVISNRSSSRGGEPRSSTTTTNSTLAEKTDAPSPIPKTDACRNCDWRTFKKSLKGLWKSAHGVKSS